MNAKITLPRLVSLLAETTGRTKKSCEDFLRMFFGVISEQLSEGESVKIKDLGIFKVTLVEARKSVNVATGEEYLIPGHKKVTFLPSKSIAEAVNAPFEMFETVEVNDSVSENDLLDVDDVIGPTPEILYESEGEFPFREEDPEIVENNYQDAEEHQQNDIEPLTLINENPKQESINEEDIHEDSTIKEGITIAEKESEMFSDIRSGEVDNEELSEHVPESDNLDQLSDAEILDGSADENHSNISEETNTDVSEDTVSPDSIKEYPIVKMGESEKEEEISQNVIRIKRKSFSRGFFIGVGCSLLLLFICFVVFYFLMLGKIESLMKYDKDKNVELSVAKEKSNEKTPNKEGVVAIIDNENEGDVTDRQIGSIVDEGGPATTPSDLDQSEQKVYDTVSTTRYLTTIAKEHYGNYQLWPYIYEENKNILGHPDRIRPGTKVVVPPLSKYGVDPKSKEDIREAIKKGVEIYSRYN